MDFELAAWRAAAHVMPEVECKGVHSTGDKRYGGRRRTLDSDSRT